MKLYPFSAQKHAHDIEFRRARAFNEFAQSGYTDTKLEALIERLDEIRSLMVGCPTIVWLSGKQYGLAIESVAWASAERH